jgi:hypothetical protein
LKLLTPPPPNNHPSCTVAYFYGLEKIMDEIPGNSDAHFFGLLIPPASRVFHSLLGSRRN